MAGLKSTYFNVNDSEIMSSKTNRDIPEAIIVSDEEAAVIEAAKLKSKIQNKIPASVVAKAKALQNGTIVQSFMADSKYVTKGALIGIGSGFLLGMYFKKSIMLSCLLGGFAGGLGGKLFAKAVNSAASTIKTETTTQTNK